MLETILGLALLPFAIATGIALLATIYLIIVKSWKMLVVLLVAFAAVIALLAQSPVAFFALCFVTLVAFLWAIGGFTDTANPQDSTDHLRNT